jgi:hypothetical protein
MLARLDSNEKDVDCFYRGSRMSNGQILLAATRTRRSVDELRGLPLSELEAPVNISCAGLNNSRRREAGTRCRLPITLENIT